jgi:Tol biopolymer transport system component
VSRRGAAAVGLAVVAAGLVAVPPVLVTAPASAVAPGLDGPLVFVADAVSNGHQDVLVSQPDGSGRVNLTAENRAYVTYAAEPSPDGRRIAYTRGGEAQDEVWVMDADGSGKTRLTDGTTSASNPAWSPDGARIAFGRSGDVWTMAADGTDQERFVEDGSAPEYAPDGTAVAFVRSDLAAGSRIWVRGLDGSEADLTAYNDRATAPSWSPDGERILFWHDSGDVEGLYTITPSGLDLTLLKAGPLSHFRSYTWSPSGTRIAYTGSESGNDEIWVMDADGTDAVQVTDEGAAVEHQAVAWSAPPEADPTELPTQVQGTAITPVPLAGPAGAVFEVTDGALPPGLSLSPGGLLTGTPTQWGRSVFEVTATGDGAPAVMAYALRVLDPDDPLASITSPGQSSGTSHPVALALDVGVRWLGSDATTRAVTYDVRHRVAAWNGSFGGYVAPPAWQGLDTTSLVHPLSPGRTSCYSARATDESGRLGGWGAERCTVAPLDQGSLARSGGWRTVSGGTFYGGTALSTTRKGRTLTRTGARMVRVGIVTTTCPTCGKVAVSIGSTRIGTINLRRGSGTFNRKAIMLPRFSLRSGTVRVTTLTRKRKVVVDGLIVSAR